MICMKESRRSLYHVFILMTFIAIGVLISPVPVHAAEGTTSAQIPDVTNATTAEDTQSTSGLVIEPKPGDDQVTHFKISNIIGGRLYKNDGITEILHDTMITKGEGAAGLKFTPDADANGTSFSFEVRAAWDDNGEGLSEAATAYITVTEVNDPPVAAADNLSPILEDSGPRTIPFANLLANDSAGPANESGQTLTITAVSDEIGGTAAIVGTDVVFTPAPDYFGPAGFTYTVTDDGQTSGADDFKSATANVSFTITEVNDAPAAADDVLPDIAEDSAPLTISIASLLANDKAGPANESGQTLTLQSISGVTGGTAAIEGADIVFTLTPDYHGHAGFTNTVRDNGTTDGAPDPMVAFANVSFTVIVANDPPTGTFEINNGENRTNNAHVLLSISGSDPNDDLTEMSFSNDDLNWSDWMPYQSSLMWTLSENDGLKNVYMKLRDSQGATSGVYSAAILLDTTKPVITLNGDREVHIKLGMNYVDAGAVAFDAIDGDLTDQMTVTSNVYTSNLGTYYVQYTVTDKSGNTAIEQRNVTVIDSDQPIITLKGQSEITLLLGQAYVEPGYTAEDDIDGDITSQVTVTGSVYTDQIGTYYLYYNVMDTNGRSASTVTRTIHVTSDNALLQALEADLALSPTFHPSITSYTATVPYHTNNVTVEASVADPSASLTINGISKGTHGSAEVILRVGVNEIPIIVTAHNGTTKQYTLTITRKAEERDQSPSDTPQPQSLVAETKRQAYVVAGDGRSQQNIKLDMIRSVTSEGIIIDSLTLDGGTVDKLIGLISDSSIKTARIVISDSPESPADEMVVSVQSNALSKLGGAGFDVVIEMKEVKITLLNYTCYILCNQCDCTECQYQQLNPPSHKFLCGKHFSASE